MAAAAAHHAAVARQRQYGQQPPLPQYGQQQYSVGAPTKRSTAVLLIIQILDAPTPCGLSVFCFSFSPHQKHQLFWKRDGIFEVANMIPIHRIYDNVDMATFSLIILS